MRATDKTPAPGPERQRRTDARGERAFEGAGRLAHALVGAAPRRSLLAVGLLFAAVVTETFGIALLIPLLSAVGVGGAPDSGAGSMGDAFRRGAEALGVELTLPVLLGAFVALAALRSGAAWQRDNQLATLRLGFVDRLRGRLFSATAMAAWPFLVRRRSSDLLHVLTHDVGRAGQGAMILIRGSVTITFALGQCALAVAISPPIAFGMLLAGAALLTAARPLVLRSRVLGADLTASGRRVHATMTEFLGGLKVAKSDATEASHVRQYTGALAATRREQLDFTGTSSAARALLNVGGAAALAVLVGVSVTRAGLGAPELLVMALIASRLLPSLLRVQQEAQQLAHVLPAWLHTLETERTLREAAEPPADPETPPLPLHRELALRGVGFSYHDPASAGAPALAGVDLSIRAHRLVAVSGPSGAGKTTLVDLLLGLIEPDTGEIRVDGEPLTGALRRRWRGSVAYVPQDPHLFHETLRANLLRARPDAGGGELRQALRLAAAAEFVAALPEGLNTVAGDRGGRLSGGERQRIVLARALLRQPTLLLLDEATNQLDAETERQILVGLRSLPFRTTVVAVTHRESVLDAADQVVRLEAGRIAAPVTPSASPSGPTSGMAAARPRTAAALPWLGCLLAALLIPVGSTAHAQTGEDFRSQATMRAGPLYLKPAFRLDRLGWESNVFGRPDPQPDFVVSGTPRVDAWLPLSRRAHIATTFIGAADWYAEYAGERAFNPEIQSRIVLPWRRITLTAGGSYLRTRRRPDFEIDVRSNRFRNDLHGGIAVQVLSRLWLDLEARQRRVGFDGDVLFEGTYLSETLNRKERSAVVSLRFQPTALTTLVLTSEVREMRFGRSPERDSDNVVLTAGADFHPRGLVSGSGRIGVRRFQAVGAGVTDISSVVAEANLSLRITGNATATFRATRDINYSFERGAPYFLIGRYGLSVTRRLGRRFDLSGRVTRDGYDYRTARRGRDLRWNGIAEFGYRLRPGVRAGIQGGYIKWESAARARRRHRRFVLGLVLDYDIGT